MADHPTYHVNVIKLKREIIWTDGLTHLSALHLPGVPHLHVKRGLSANIVNILHSKDTIKFELKCTSHRVMYGLHSDSIMDVMKIT